MKGYNTVELGEKLKADVEILIDTRALICASSGGGKSYLMRLIAEQLIGTYQVLILDAEGEFSTLTEKHDILVARKGGPVEPDVKTARLLARRLVEMGSPAVIDLYDIRAQGMDVWESRQEFVAQFVDGVMDVSRDLWHPVVLLIDEAHRFAPESAGAKKDSPVLRSRRAIVNLMSAGRKRGFCGVLATQRISKLDKDAIADAKNVFIGGTTLDLDIDRAGDILGLARKDRLVLRDLAPGTFYCFGPALPKGVTQFKSNKTETTHPSAKNRRSIKPPPPSSYVKGLVAELGDIAGQVQEELDEKKKLVDQNIALRYQTSEATKTIIRLTADIERLKQQPPSPAPPTKVEVPVFKDGEINRLHDALERMLSLTSIVDDVGRKLSYDLETTRNAIEKKPVFDGSHKITEHAIFAKPGYPQGVLVDRQIFPQPMHVTKDLSEVTGPEMKILTALAPYPEGKTKKQVALLAGYKASGGGFVGPFNKLVDKGMISGVIGSRVYVVTQVGKSHVGTDLPPVGGWSLRKYWEDKLKAKAEHDIFVSLCQIWPRSVSKIELAEMNGYSSKGGGFVGPLNKNVTRGIVTKEDGMYKASDMFFQTE